jgi:hypothetical protein
MRQSEFAADLKFLFIAVFTYLLVLPVRAERFGVITRPAHSALCIKCAFQKAVEKK